MTAKHNLDDAETEIVLLALHRVRYELSGQIAGNKGYLQVGASAWHCCCYVRGKIEALIQKLESPTTRNVEVKNDLTPSGG